MSPSLHGLLRRRFLDRLKSGIASAFEAEPDELRLLLQIENTWALVKALPPDTDLSGGSGIVTNSSEPFSPMLRTAVGLATRLHKRHLPALEVAEECFQFNTFAHDTRSPESRAAARILRLYFWCCATSFTWEAEAGCVAVHTLRQTFTELTDELYAETTQALEAARHLGALSPLLVDLSPRYTRDGVQRFVDALTSLSELDNLRAQQRHYRAAAALIASTGQACNKAMRAAGLDTQVAEDAAYMDLQVLERGRDELPDRITGHSTHRDQVRRLRDQLFGPEGEVRSELRRSATDLRSFLRQLGVAQITGFIRNPVGVDNDIQRAYRQIADHFRIPFVFTEAGSPSAADNLKDDPQREGRFLEALRVTWPARHGVSKNALRTLFKGAQQHDAGALVLIPDGEVSFPFILSVLLRCRAEERGNVQGWLEDRHALRTKFSPQKVPVTAQLESWLDDELWSAGTFSDFVAQTGLVVRDMASPRAFALLDHLSHLAEQDGLDSRARDAACAFLQLGKANASVFKNVLRSVVGSYLHRQELVDVSALRDLCRVSYFPEVMLRLSPDLQGAETDARTLFLLVTQWDYDRQGNPDVPISFIGGTLLWREAASHGVRATECGSAVALLSHALTPMLAAAISQVLVDGAQQKVLTEREKDLRRQIAHTMNNDILRTKFAFGTRVARLTTPLLNIRNSTQRDPSTLLSNLLRSNLSAGAVEQHVKSALEAAERQKKRLGADVGDKDNDQWPIELVAAAARGDARATLVRLAQIAERLDGYRAEADRELTRLADISRVFARLSERKFRAHLTALPGEPARRLSFIVRQSIATTMHWVIARASSEAANPRLEGLRQAFALGDNRSDNDPPDSEAGNWDQARLSDYITRLLRRPVTLQFAVPEALWLADDDGRIVVGAMLSELANNACRALRPVRGEVSISCTVEGSVSGLKSVEWSNTTDEYNGNRLKTLSDGGQGIAFLKECALALMVSGPEAAVEPDYDVRRSLAIVRLR